ncbi:hypothetical protein [Chryseobacterium vaccae]|nr:hypothetical protein [Chryseobacterium vaccae]
MYHHTDAWGIFYLITITKTEGGLENDDMVDQSGTYYQDVLKTV